MKSRLVVVVTICLSSLGLFLMLASGAAVPTAAETVDSWPGPGRAASVGIETPVQAGPDCALLDDPVALGKMSYALETKLLVMCGRIDDLAKRARPLGQPVAPLSPLLGNDVQVNNSGTDTGSQTTQSETSIAVNLNTGTICSAHNDSQHYTGSSSTGAFAGFSSSTNGGISFTDHGGFPAGGGGITFGDPSMVWRRSDGYFYYASLHTNGLGLWRSTDDCQSFAFLGMIHTGTDDDKELMAVDNSPASPHYGRFYVAWTDFSTAGGDRIWSTYSDNPGVSWSSPTVLSGSGVDVQGAWPTVAPNGDAYVAWVRWNPYYTGPIDVEIARSTNGGSSFSLVTNPLTGGVNPYSVTPTCGLGSRPSLNGPIRYLPSPQIAVGPNGDLHVVYVRDPDAHASGDVINVYYRRSSDNGATWSPEFQVNDDGTQTDQFFPTISVGPNNAVVVTYYSRQHDSAGNMLFDYYMRASFNGGVSWQPSKRVSDVSSPVAPTNPNFDPVVADCYHGDYDQQAQTSSYVYLQWSDDRNIQNSHNDPDVWFDREPLLTEIGALTGVVSDAVSLAPVGGAPVQATLNMTYTFDAISDGSGVYNMIVASGTYTLTASKYGYLPATLTGVSVVSGTTTTQNIALTPAAQYVISGIVTDSVTGDPLWATVEIEGIPFSPPTTTVQTDPSTGFYSQTVAGGQSYTLTVSALFHSDAARGIGVPVSDQTQDFALTATTTNGGLLGYVRNYYTDQPIPNALVTTDAPGNPSATTNISGYYQILNLPPGYYTATATAALYSPVAITNVHIVTSNVTFQDFLLPTSHLDYAPTHLEKAMTLGQVITDSAGWVISNTGVGALTFDIYELPGGFAPAFSGLLPNGGGPDPYGYTWKASNEAGGPVYAWIDATDGTALNLTDDAEANVTSPFPFPLYGASSTDLRVGNNGGVLQGVTSGDVAATNLAIADSGAPNFLLAPFWDDIDDETGNVYWKVLGSSPNRKLVVEWYNRPHYTSSGGIGTATFEMVLFEDGDILYQYQDVNFGNATYDSGASATVGIRGPDAADSLQYSFNTPSLQDNFAICFDNPTNFTSCGLAVGGDLPWLSESPISGTVPASNSQSIALMWSTAVTEAQQIGVYTGSLWLVTNDPANQNVFVPVTLTVTAPDLIISKSGPSTALPGETITYTIVYTNAGTAVASNVMITDTLPPGMTTLSPTSWNVGSVNVNGGSSIVFTATVDSNVQGAPLLTNKVVIASSDVEINANNNSAETTLQVAAPDLIISKSGPATASPDEVITYTLIYTNVGDSTAQDVMITDTLPMSVSTAAPTGWSVGAVAPSAHGAIVFTATVDHAVPGNAVLANHVVIATVTSESNTTNNAAESSLTVPPPELELSEYSIDITLPQDTLVTRTLVISNVGPTNLTWNLTETTNVTWLNESPDNGVVVPGGSTPVAVTFDTTGLAAGFYPTRLLITGNDPTHMPIEVPIRLTVAALPPDITMNPDPMSLTLTTGDVATETMMIGNVGGQDLTWSAAEVPPVSWLDESLSNGLVAPASTNGIVMTFTAPLTSTVSVYTTTLRVTSNDPDENPYDMLVTLTVNPRSVFLPLVTKN